MTQTTDNDGTSQLFRTVRALELLGKSHDAWARGDVDACDALVRQAHTEVGVETILIQGGMRIGEIPTPDDEAWPEYLQHQRDRLAAELNAATEPAPDADEYNAWLEGEQSAGRLLDELGDRER